MQTDREREIAQEIGGIRQPDKHRDRGSEIDKHTENGRNRQTKR